MVRGILNTWGYQSLNTWFILMHTYFSSTYSALSMFSFIIILKEPIHVHDSYWCIALWHLCLFSVFCYSEKKKLSFFSFISRRYFSGTFHELPVESRLITYSCRIEKQRTCPLLMNIPALISFSWHRPSLALLLTM